MNPGRQLPPLDKPALTGMWGIPKMSDLSCLAPVQGRHAQWLESPSEKELPLFDMVAERCQAR